MIRMKKLEAVHCQICGRDIHGLTGKIAHHGYTRPHQQHYQTSSCAGARELPYEASRDVLGQAIEGAKNAIERHKEHLARVEREEDPAIFTYKKSRRWGERNEVVIVELRRDTFEEKKKEHGTAFMTHSLYDFDKAKMSTLQSIERSIKEWQMSLDYFKQRFNEWKLTHEYRKHPPMWVRIDG